MSVQQVPLTHESILEMFRETREQMKETDRRMKETDRKIQETSEQMKKTDRMIQETSALQKKTERTVKRTSKLVGDLGSRIGKIVENMVKGDIVAKFRAFDYEIDDYCEKKKFENNKIGVHGEIDLFLENGDIAILIEIKTTLETKDVRKHIDRLEKFRRYVDAKGVDKRRFIGAVAGAVIEGEAEEFAHENGIYVIVQSGKAVDIVTPPEGFVANKW